MADLTRSNVESYAELVVRDFLQSRGYFGALEALTEDVAAAKLERKEREQERGGDVKEEEDSIASWYIVNQHLGLPTLLNENRTTESKRYNSVVEVIVDALAQQQTKESEPAPWVRPSTTPNFQFPLKANIKSQNQVSSPPSSPMGDEIRAQSQALTRPKSQGLPRTHNANSSQYRSTATIKRQFKPLINTINGKTKSNQNWIPENVRQNQVRRDLAVAKINVESTVVREEAARTEKGRHKLDALETSKCKEKLQLLKKLPCGLCCVTFLPVNLILAVPLKAVLDIRDSWGTKFDPKGASKVRVNTNLRKAPLCYDEVKVCGFCSQLFQYQQDNYRPSWEAKEAERIRIKDEQEAKQRKAFWDPLTTTELERKKEMADMKLRIERGDDWVDPGIKNSLEEEPGPSVRLARKTLVRTTSSGRIVRERMKPEVSPNK
ncbi:hypothetical protein TrLO_g12670 [Triparma laevis f. longispina]|uniref:LisH domain-containing protein n=1 Tax=Triparma laevis f. longispina TaxID=1714387 RepID=A0A9W7A8J7_9STRA|nr:hypothetical protein TrLO_g12670 [Triparma laevis f. longispina]